MNTFNFMFSAINTLAAVVVAIVAIVAWCTAKGTLEAARKSAEAALQTAESAVAANRQLERDSIARSRPYVHTRLAPSLMGYGHWDLIIENSGLTAAHELIVEFLENADDPVPASDAINESIKNLKKPRTIPPRSWIRIVWRVAPPRQDEIVKHGNDLQGMPASGQLSISYLGRNTDSETRYTETFEANVPEEHWPIPPRHNRAESASYESQITSLMQALVENVAELRR